jgi:hypothetical protein
MIPDPDPHKRIQVFLTLKSVRDVHPGSKFFFHPYPDSYPGVKKAPDPGSGSATLLQNLYKLYQEEAEEDEGPPDEVRLWEDGFKDRSAYVVSFLM